MSDATSRGEAAAARLRATSAELIDQVRSLPDELIYWIPADGVWSVMDNLCHVREFVPFWTKQVVQITTAPDQEWGRTHTDTDRIAAVTDTMRVELDDVLGDIRAETDAAAATLATLTDAALATEAKSRNPKWGIKPAAFVVEELIVGHLEKHLGQIRRNIGQFKAKG